jgi:hypothetical protein
LLDFLAELFETIFCIFFFKREKLVTCDLWC